MNFCFQTHTGRLVNPLAPKPGDIALMDIAHALGHVCRFGGHCNFHYSVALHSLNVSLMVEKYGGSTNDCVWGLLHDASEAYLGDMVRPLKHQPEMAPYREAEARLQSLICTHFELPQEEPALVRDVDRRMCVTEGPIVFENSVRLWNESGLPFEHESWPAGMEIAPLDHVVVVRRFLDRFQHLDRNPYGRAAR